MREGDTQGGKSPSIPLRLFPPDRANREGFLQKQWEARRDAGTMQATPRHGRLAKNWCSLPRGGMCAVNGLPEEA